MRGGASGALRCFILGFLFVGCDGPVAGAVGESCAARADCQDGLACIQQTCVEGGPATGSGQVGETCGAPTDCADGLACVANVCIPEKSALTPTGKACYAVECEAKDDCCAGFQPSPNCPTYEMECATDPSACATFHLLCECNRDCVDARCVDTPLACASNDECLSFATPFCVDGSCHECAVSTDCAGAESLCVDGSCEAPCQNDEECPLFYGCQAGECVEVGCQTDKECAFYLRDDRAHCDDGACGVPCEADWQCAPELGEISLDACIAGVCTFVGCDTDAECRAYLGLENENSNVQAVCK
jgi:hypothetical protein